MYLILNALKTSKNALKSKKVLKMQNKKLQFLIP